MMTSTIYRPLTPSDQPQARSLWETCFDDPAAFVDWYFDNRFPPEHARGLFENGRLLCMVQAVPYRIRVRDIWFPSFYIVGLATHPSARQNGLATRLLEHLLQEKYLAGLGFTVLMPAIPPFYARRGWAFCYELQDHLLVPGSLPRPHGQLRELASSDISTLDSLYHKTFASANGLFQRTLKDWQDLLHDHALDNGRAALYMDENNLAAGYVLYRPTEERLLVRESAFSEEPYGVEALSLLASIYPGLPVLWQSGNGQLPPIPPVQSSQKPTTMARAVHLAQWLSAIPYPPEINFNLRLSVFDPLIPQNRRAFYWRIRSGVGSLTPIPDNSSYLQVGIAELTSWIMGTAPDLPEEVRKIFPPRENYCNDLF